MLVLLLKFWILCLQLFGGNFPYKFSLLSALTIKTPFSVRPFPSASGLCHLPWFLLTLPQLSPLLHSQPSAQRSLYAPHPHPRHLLIFPLCLKPFPVWLLPRLLNQSPQAEVPMRSSLLKQKNAFYFLFGWIFSSSQHSWTCSFLKYVFFLCPLTQSFPNFLLTLQSILWELWELVLFYE